MYVYTNYPTCGTACTQTHDSHRLLGLRRDVSHSGGYSLDDRANLRSREQV